MYASTYNTVKKKPPKSDRRAWHTECFSAGAQQVPLDLQLLVLVDHVLMNSANSHVTVRALRKVPLRIPRDHHMYGRRGKISFNM